MAKKLSTSRHRQRKDTGDERARRVEAQMLARAVRQQQRIRDLSRRLTQATASADRALRDVGRMVLDRETGPSSLPLLRDEEHSRAPVGGVHDARD